MAEPPFEFVSGGDGGPAEGSKWCGWTVVERRPSVLRWTDPPTAQTYDMTRHAVVACTSCHAVVARPVDWPDDAWWRWDVRGIVLWAWDAEHARVLHDHLAAGLRDPSRWPRHERLLRRLPAAITRAASRERVTRAIASSLERETRGLSR